MRAMKTRHIALLTGVVAAVILVGCNKNNEIELPGQAITPSNAWVHCGVDADSEGNLVHKPWLVTAAIGGSQSQYTLVRTAQSQVSGYQFNPSDYDCDTDPNSPSWQGSGKPIWPTSKPAGASALQRFGAAPKAAAPSSVSYLPELLLDLLFPAQPSPSDYGNLNCSSSQPDVMWVNHNNGFVNRISTCPFQPVARISVTANPLQIAITPDGTTALVTSYNNAITFINLATNQVTFTLQTPNIYPNGIAITPDGTKAYVTNFLPSQASIVEYDLNTHEQISSLSAPTYPHSVFLSPDGGQLFVTFPYANLVWVIDTMTNTLSYSLSIPVPRGVGFNTHGTKAYISSADDPDHAVKPGTVQEFDTGTFQITNTFNVGVGPTDVDVIGFDRYVIVNNFEEGSGSLIDVATGTVNTTAFGGSVWGIARVR